MLQRQVAVGSQWEFAQQCLFYPKALEGRALVQVYITCCVRDHVELLTHFDFEIARHMCNSGAAKLLL